MALTAGVLSQVSVSSNSDQLAATSATMGTGPYTQQWYRSTTTGFTPGGGNIVAGATALTLNDSGLIPNTVYYYKVVYTDAVAATATSVQLAVTTTPTQLSQNVFSQSPIVGMPDMNFNYNTHSALVDATAPGLLYNGQAVKMVAHTSGGDPKVVACTASNDNVFGFVTFNVKNVSWAVGQAMEVSCAGNVIWLYANSAITQGAQVCLDVAAAGAVQATGNAATVVGYALDGAAAAGVLIRVQLNTPSFATA